jgi:hypothetical protein
LATFLSCDTRVKYDGIVWRVILMKSILYRSPVITAITINLLTALLFVYSLSERIIPLAISLMLIGVINRKIIDNGINLTNNSYQFYIANFTN